MITPKIKELVLEGRSINADGSLGNDRRFHTEWMGTTTEIEEEDHAELKRYQLNHRKNK